MVIQETMRQYPPVVFVTRYIFCHTRISRRPIKNSSWYEKKKQIFGFLFFFMEKVLFK